MEISDNGRLNLIRDRSKSFSKSYSISENKTLMKWKNYNFSDVDLKHMQSLDEDKAKYMNQDLIGSSWLHRIHEPPFNFIIMYLLSLFIVTLGVLVLLLSSDTTSKLLQYSENQQDSEITVTLKDIGWKNHKSAYIYFYIEPFYDTSQTYLKSRPKVIYGQYNCRSADTLGVLRQIRKIPETIPDFPVALMKSDEQSIFPCGYASFSVFNDKISLKEGARTIPLTLEGLDRDVRFVLHTTKERPPGIDKKNDWIDVKSYMYRSWMRSQISSKKKLLIGRVTENLNKDTEYKISLDQNVWPSEVFGTRKYVIIEQLSLIGSSQKFLSYVYLCTGGIFLFSSFFINLLHFYRKSSMSKYSKVY